MALPVASNKATGASDGGVRCAVDRNSVSFDCGLTSRNTSIRTCLVTPLGSDLGQQQLQSRHESSLSPMLHHHTPSSPSTLSVSSSSMSYNTPALSSGTMSTSSSQDGFSPASQAQSHFAPSPVMVYPNTMQHLSTGLGVAGLGVAGQYLPVASAPSASKQASGGRVYLSPPGVNSAPNGSRGLDYSLGQRERDLRPSRRDLDLGPAPLSASMGRSLEEPTRKGGDIGIDLGEFDMMDTLGELSSLKHHRSRH